jgi:hypothetical protein
MIDEYTIESKGVWNKISILYLLVIVGTWMCYGSVMPIVYGYILGWLMSREWRRGKETEKYMSKLDYLNKSL